MRFGGTEVNLLRLFGDKNNKNEDEEWNNDLYYDDDYYVDYEEELSEDEAESYEYEDYLQKFEDAVREPERSRSDYYYDRPRQADEYESWSNNRDSRQGYDEHFYSDRYVSRAEKKRSRGFLRGLIRLIIILAVIGIGIYSGFQLWVKPPSIANPNDKSGQNGDVPQTTAEKIEGIAPAAMDMKNRRDSTYTFAIVGKDVEGSHTDTVILGMFDIKEKNLNFATIPRDTLINTSWDVKKINYVYPASKNTGKDATANLLAAFKDLLGFPIDCYAIVDIQAAEKLVDAIGGVYFDVPCDMKWDAPDQAIPLHIDIKAGHQLLSGADAVNVFRFRYSNDGSNSYKRGDIDRIEVQQNLLKAIMKQLLTVGNIPNFGKAIKIYEESVETNMTAANVAYFGQEFLKIGFDSIKFMTLPGKTDGLLFGISYVFPDIDAWLKMVNENLNPFTVPVTRENVDMLTFNGIDFETTQGKIRGGRFSFYGANK